jgi:hypothetical protein
MSMGCSRDFLAFFDLPFYYDPIDFGLPGEKAPKGSIYFPGNELKKSRYSNGQPMGLFLSFPMFELAHYTIAKFSVASTFSEFSICGDDIVFACKNKEEGTCVYNRYKDVIESLGGKIEPLKSVESPLVEGVGKLIYTTVKGEIIDLTPPNGNISPVEGSQNTYLRDIISRRTPIGRAILYSWTSPAELKRYTYKDRRRFWSWLLNSEYFLSRDAYNSLFKEMEGMPQEWYWDADEPVLLRELRSPFPADQYKFVSSATLREAILTTKIKSLIRKEA